MTDSHIAHRFVDQRGLDTSERDILTINWYSLLSFVLLFTFFSERQATGEPPVPTQYYLRGDSNLVTFYDMFGYPNAGRTTGSFSSVQKGPPVFTLNDQNANWVYRNASEYSSSGEWVNQDFISSRSYVPRRHAQDLYRGTWDMLTKRPPAGAYRIYSSRQDGLFLDSSYTGNIFKKELVSITSGKNQAWGYTPAPTSFTWRGVPRWANNAVSVVGPAHPLRNNGRPGQPFPMNYQPPSFPMIVTPAQRIYVLGQTGLQLTPLIAIGLTGIDDIGNGLTNESLSTENRILRTYRGTTTTLLTTGGGGLVVGQGLQTAGYLTAGHAVANGGIAVINTGAYAGAFAGGYALGRGIDYSTGNRLTGYTGQALAVAYDTTAVLWRWQFDYSISREHWRSFNQDLKRPTEFKMF